jgi:hypothetical protein
MFFSEWSPARNRFMFVVKSLTLLGIIGGIAFGLYTGLSQPFVRKHLPPEINNTMKEAEETYLDAFGEDLLLQSITLEAKLLDHERKMVHFKSGETSELHYKKLEIEDGVHIEVTLEKFRAPAFAAKRFINAGGKGDELALGFSSTIESHGLDVDQDYYLNVVMQYNENYIHMKLSKQLTAQEKNIAKGRGFQNLMQKFYLTSIKSMEKVIKLQAETMVEAGKKPVAH